ncbi:hypothetical protein SmJEL517_g00162 [Synchytrium microbalum]|uniref:C2H2-type domain-containing protein n=1 Tax=Synchytrium microbalum TaxID=1806994 RepID=A0A507CIR8_9FUNG|nr:uncharacterized protein SmJEL517_g00162 [Synchytrium microbalum]TPX38126.1 hypothetical protein SmJEL517_g00162 [Synchytrium microbalum]
MENHNSQLLASLQGRYYDALTLPNQVPLHTSESTASISLETPTSGSTAESNQVDTSVASLKNFLKTAIHSLIANQQSPAVVQHHLAADNIISCVLWNGENGDVFISGTDVLKIVEFLLVKLGRPIREGHLKKWEEGLFSDLRQLKVPTGCSLEQPRSRLLQYLFQAGAIRTQKKQKVFKLQAVKIEKLFLEALRRDLKRVEMGQPSTTEVKNESTTEAIKRAHALLAISPPSHEEALLVVRTPGIVDSPAQPTPSKKQSNKRLRKSHKTRKSRDVDSDESDNGGWDSEDSEDVESSDEESFDCNNTGCTKSFSSAHELRKHVNRKHSNESKDRENSSNYQTSPSFEISGLFGSPMAPLSTIIPTSMMQGGPSTYTMFTPSHQGNNMVFPPPISTYSNGLPFSFNPFAFTSESTFDATPFLSVQHGNEFLALPRRVSDVLSFPRRESIMSRRQSYGGGGLLHDGSMLLSPSHNLEPFHDFLLEEYIAGDDFIISPKRHSAHFCRPS